MLNNFFEIFARQKLNKIIGENDLKFDYLITFSQGDFLRFHGTLENNELIQAAKNILDNADHAESPMYIAKLRNSLVNWVERFEVDCTIDGDHYKDSEYHLTLADINSDNDEIIFINADDETSVYEGCEDVSDHVFNAIKNEADVIKTQITDILCNLEQEIRPMKTYKTKNFKVEISEEKIFSIDDLAEEDSFVLETATGLANGSLRAFDLTVDISKLSDDGDYIDIASSSLGSIVMDSATNAGYMEMIRSVTSEAVQSARTLLQQQKAA